MKSKKKKKENKTVLFVKWKQESSRRCCVELNWSLMNKLHHRSECYKTDDKILEINCKEKNAFGRQQKQGFNFICGRYLELLPTVGILIIQSL